MLQYFKEQFNKQTGVGAIRAFVEYVLLVGLRKENIAEKLFNIYQQMLQRVEKEDFLLSQVSWSFWQSSVWIEMMKEVLFFDSQSVQEQHDIGMLESFCNLLTPNVYRDYVDVRVGKSPVLEIGKLGMIHLNFLTILLIELHGELNGSKRKKVEATFTDCFLGVQIQGCDPFSVESMRILDAESVVLRCMEAFSMICEKLQDKIILFLKKQPVEKILFYIDYIDNQRLKEKLLNVVVERKEESFRESISFLPTWQNLIVCMINICFQNNEKTLVSKIKELLEDFEKVVEGKGRRIKVQYESWIKEKKIHLEILLGNEKQILETDLTPIFYKAFIYLNREDLESLKKAEEMYGQCLDSQAPNSSVYINYFVACVRICTHIQISEVDKIKYLQKARETAEFIWEKCELTLQNKECICANELFLYSELQDNDSFWKSSTKVPEELKYKISCGVYYVKMYAYIGEKEKAREFLGELALRYGETKQLLQLRREVEGEDLIDDAERLISKAGIFETDGEIQRLQNAYCHLSKLTEKDCALVRLQKDLMHPEETNLLEMVINAVNQMEQYSDYLLFDGKTAQENSYNKFVQILFNQRQSEMWDYHLKDQSQEGTATGILKDGRNSVGSLDLALYHSNRLISIIETVKLKRIDTNKIEEHIRKVAGYNYAHVQVAFQIILADYQNPLQMWKEYEQKIKEIIDKTVDNDWYITKCVQPEELELFQLHILPTPKWFLMTVHECRLTGQSFHMYHIMVDILKKAEKDEAVMARNHNSY